MGGCIGAEPCSVSHGQRQNVLLFIRLCQCAGISEGRILYVDEIISKIAQLIKGKLIISLYR